MANPNPLFVLASIATMTDNERDAACLSASSASRSIFSASTTTTTTTTTRTRSHSSSSVSIMPSAPSFNASSNAGTQDQPTSSSPAKEPISRGPAKKRAVPKEFDMNYHHPDAPSSSLVTFEGDTFHNNHPSFAPSSYTRPPFTPSYISTLPSPTTEYSAPLFLPPKRKSLQTTNSSTNVLLLPTKKKRRRKLKSDTANFPTILMGIMTTPKNDDFIAFLSDEERFIVVDPRGLEKEVLTEYFDEDVSTYDQFVEMLDRWGFKWWRMKMQSILASQCINMSYLRKVIGRVV
eukprot:g2994.t1 g2994   contig12:1223173-1224045(+)